VTRDEWAGSFEADLHLSLPGEGVWVSSVSQREAL
jgi:hypothetical protein